MSLLLEAFVQAVTEMSVPPTLDPPHIRAQRRFPKPKAEEPLETRVEMVVETTQAHIVMSGRSLFSL
jgi:hypothetical protein